MHTFYRNHIEISEVLIHFSQRRTHIPNRARFREKSQFVLNLTKLIENTINIYVTKYVFTKKIYSTINLMMRIHRYKCPYFYM